MKIYCNKSDPLDRVGLHDDGTIEYVDPNIGSMLHKLADAQAWLSAGYYIPDTDYEDACRFRMIMYAAANDGSPEAAMMDELNYQVNDDLTNEQRAALVAGHLDQVRAKFGEKVWP